MTANILGIVCTVLVTINIAHSQLCRIDLGFILDDSGSIKSWGFEQEKRFIRDVTRQLRISSTDTRIAVMTFSTGARMRINFRDRAGQNWNSLNSALNWVRHSGGWTYTHRALDLARNQMYNPLYGARTGAPKMLLLLTDGQAQSQRNQLQYSATALKNKFVNIMSIGVGYQIRRSELELIASRPIHQHVFQVRDAGALTRIVNTVKTEACKPITCWFTECIYNEWSSWSGTCYQVARTRTVRRQIRKSKLVVGGCAGLHELTCKTKVERKNLGVCLKTCPYVKCNWAPWGSWAATCGRTSRTRVIKAERATTQRRNCAGLPQRCYQKPQTQGRTTKCTCNYVVCNYGPWSQWTTTCGRGQRARKMIATRKTIQRESCSGLTTSCPTQPDIQSRNQKCTCNYVECKYGPWSAWTTTCGKGERSRKMQTIRKTVQRENCNGLTQSCPAKTDLERRTTMCTCNYVECGYGPWSAWSTSCGKGERSRKMQATKKTVQKESCAGLTQSCPATTDVGKRTTMCTCNYVECGYGPWSAWTTSCGKGERSRKMQATKKTIQKESCAGLTQSCPATTDVGKRTTMCTCNYVECGYGPWSAWSTSCGKGERSRKMQATKKTIQKESCAGLTQSCPAKTDVGTRTEMCSCSYVDCQYGPWTQWSTSCGKGERARKLQPIKKTKQAESCDGLPQTCSVKPEVATRTEMCTCSYVDCEYGAWTEWSTSCGKGERARKLQPIKKSKQAESCDGLTQTCSAKPEVETRTEMCKCETVECKYSEWSDWNPACGKNIVRKRTLQTLKKTVEKESCDGLPKSCVGEAEQTEKKDELCECDAVRCELQWSAWSATCGLATRKLRNVEIPIKVKQESCDNVKKTCEKIEETQTDDFFCARTLPPVKTDGPASDATCNVPYKGYGCFKDSKDSRGVLSNVLFKEPYVESKTFSFTDHVMEISCRCALMAKAKGFDVFALSEQGECLAGKNSNDSWRKHSARYLKECRNADRQACTMDDSNCIGAKETLYAYNAAL